MSNLTETWVGNDKSSLKINVPAYLEKIYWWAYIRPKAVKFFEKQWVINMILWGNFEKLRDHALNEMGRIIPGRTLQVACVYGDFSSRLAQRIAHDGSLDIVDVLPIQLENVRRKLLSTTPVRTILSDSTSLEFASDATYDQAILFFLLHEMPESVREKTLSEALRVLKPGGRLVIVDYHKPSIFHPLRYLFPPVFKLLEPFALDLWHQGVERWIPSKWNTLERSKKTFFGGLYQMVVIHR